MQENLWGELEDFIPLQRLPRRIPETTSYTPEHCACYGHTWEYFGITGLKRCTVCNIKGFCPFCTPVAPLQDAQPFYCTAHTPESGGQHDVPLHG